MFSFFAQLLIFLSIVGIIVLVLRKVVPGAVRLPDGHSWVRAILPALKIALLKTRAFAALASRKLWHLLLEVKGITKPASALTRIHNPLQKLHLPRPNLQFFKKGESADFYLKEAEELLIKENYDEAERLFIKAIKKEPRNENAYAGLGRLYLASKKYGEATETFKYLTKQFPANDAYYSSLGQAHHGNKLYDNAVEAYEKSIELAPDNARRYANLGLTLEAPGHLEEAILNYRKAVELEKNNTQFLFLLADALAKKGEKEDAEIMLEHILQLEPTNHTARERLMQLKF